MNPLTSHCSLSNLQMETDSPASSSSSTSPSPQLAPLEKLPGDLVWRLIDLTPESLFNLRITSRKMKDCVEDYARLRGNIIESLRFLGLDGYRDDVSLEIKVPDENLHLFNVRLLCYPPLLLIKRIKRSKEAANTTCEANLSLQQYNLHIASWALDSDDARILEHIGECIGRRIEKASVAVIKCGLNYQRHLATISKVIGQLKFKVFEFSETVLTNADVVRLRDTIVAHDVEHLSLIVHQVTAAEPVTILLDLSTLLQSLKIRQEMVYKFSRMGNIFFGVENIDWAPIFLEMFLRKLDKLFILNHQYPKFLDENGSNLLRKCLPEVNKKIWFETTCNHLGGSLSQGNTNSIVQDTNTTYGNALSIKHTTRVNEPAGF